MKVKDLLERLSAYPPDMLVLTDAFDGADLAPISLTEEQVVYGPFGWGPYDWAKDHVPGTRHGYDINPERPIFAALVVATE